MIDLKIFTDEEYLPKSALVKRLGTSIIDPYWNNITQYRNLNRVQLPSLRTIVGRPLSVVLTPAIKDRIEAVSFKINDLAEKLGNFKDLIEASQAKKACLSIVTRDIKEATGNQISDISLKALVSGTYMESNPNHKEVVNHFDAVSYFGEKQTGDVDDNTLSEIYSKCITPDVVTQFYRKKDFDSSLTRLKYSANPVYPYCPAEYIEMFMTPFEKWAIEGNGQTLLKAIVSLYIIDRIKPFSQMNTSVAVLFAKWMIAANSLNNYAFYAPLECLATRGNINAENAHAEVQKTGDFTYFLDWALKTLNAKLEEAVRSVNDSRINAYVQEEKIMPEYRPEPKPEPKPEPVPTLVEEPKSEIIEETPVTPEPEVIPAPAPEPIVVEEPAPIIKKEPKPAAVETPVPTPRPVRNSNIEVLNPDEMPVTVPSSTPALTDKEVKEYIIYLMETEPDLNKKQASFYATHCTEGRYYTIQQFKAQAKCVYETARTSMDKLAAKGFYKKCQIKNKFVYTPVRKRR